MSRKTYARRSATHRFSPKSFEPLSRPFHLETASAKPFESTAEPGSAERRGHSFARSGFGLDRPRQTRNGRPLSEEVRMKMEQAFKRDFSRVRVHEDEPSATGEVEAYTRNNHIHFARGKYRPDSLAGKQLLGHELAHVVQQQTGRVGGSGMQEHPHLESEADQAGMLAAQARPVAPAVAPVVNPQSSSSAAAAGVIQPKRKQKFKGIKMSLQEFHGHGQELQPQRGQQLNGDNLENLRILGHAPASGLTPETDRRVAKIQQTIKGLKGLRKASKEQSTQNLYDEDDERGFKDRLSNYTSDLQAANQEVTGSKLSARLGRGYQFRPDRGKLQTHIYHNDQHVYTLHSGPSAFSSAGHFPTGRRRYVKHGSDKDYVADDFGVPTRRDAYAVKSAFQVDALENRGVVTGRYSATYPNQNILKPTVGEKASLGYSTPAHEQARARQQNLPILPQAPARLSASDMLYFHQEFGSGERQRGVSASSTAKPLLSNEGSGFAENPGAKKLKIDTARLRRMRPGRAPEFVNLHHRIPGLKQAVQAPKLYALKNPQNRETVRTDTAKGVRYGNERNQAHFDWSVGKNRELFIKSIRQQHVKAALEPTEDERFESPISRRNRV